MTKLAELLEQHPQCIDWRTEEPENACWCGFDGDLKAARIGDYSDYWEHVADEVRNFLSQDSPS